MGWARLDDGFHVHPKVAALPSSTEGLAAVGLFTLCLTWAHGARKTKVQPGLVPWGQVDRLGGRPARKLVRLLLGVGLLDPDPQDRGVLIHDFSDYLPKRDPAEAAEAGRRGAESRKERGGYSHSNSHTSAMAKNMASTMAPCMASDARRVDAPASAPASPVPVLSTSVDRTPVLDVTREDHAKAGVAPPDQRAEHVRAARSRAGLRIEAWTDVACRRAVDAVAGSVGYDDAWAALAVLALDQEARTPGLLVAKLDDTLAEAVRLRREAGNERARRVAAAQRRAEPIPPAGVATRGASTARTVLAKRPRVSVNETDPEAPVRESA